MTKKISQLPAATSVDTNDEFVINQDGTTKKLTTANPWQFSNVNIDGGNIDGTAIGASSASSGAFTNLSYTGTLTGGTGVVNLGSGQVYKDASGNVGVGTTNPENITNSKSLEVLGNFSSFARFGSSSYGTYFAGIPVVDVGFIAQNVNPVTGTFSNVNRSASSIGLWSKSNDGYITFSTSPTNNVAPSERMRIDSSGNVGIGATAPDVLGFGGTWKVLSALGPGNLGGALQLTAGGTGGGTILGVVAFGGANVTAADKVSASIRCAKNNSTVSDASAYLQFFTNSGSSNTERMRIDSSGNVGINGAPTAISTHTVQTITGPSSTVGGLIDLATSDRSAILRAFTRTDSGLFPSIGTATNHDFALMSNDTERMRIDSSGRVGIGTTAPVNTLHVNGSATVQNSTFRVLNNALTSGMIVYPPGISGIWSESSGFAITSESSSAPIGFKQGASERMRIDSSGGVLIGTTSTRQPNTLHETRGAANSGGEALFAVYNTGSNSAAPSLNLLKLDATTSSSQRFVQFYANGISTPMGGIVGNGASNVQFASISDAREKTNIVGINGSLEKINALKPVAFDWISNKEHCPAGFVAQDVEQVFPEFVIENFSSEGQEPRKGLTGGMTGGIVAHLVKAIQELTAKVKQLEAQLGA